jgi:hypothetical protein
MSNPRKTTVSFGKPVSDLPGSPIGGKRGPSEHWLKVAEHVRSNPGEWHPITLGHLTVKGHAGAASSINAASRNVGSKTGKNTAFMEPGFQAAFRDGRLYVRYDAPAVAKLRRAQ